MTDPLDTPLAGHGFTPGRFAPEACRVMLARRPCPFGKEDHDLSLPAEDIDSFGRHRRPTKEQS